MSTEIFADPDVPFIRITREFAASPDKVYRAHVDPELVVLWTGPDGFKIDLDVWDPRVGGSFRYVAVGKKSPEDRHAFRGCFHDLRPGELIVQTFTWEGDPDGVALERLELHDLGDGRTRLVGTSLVDSFTARDQWMASGMEAGINDGYAKLDALLAG